VVGGNRDNSTPLRPRGAASGHQTGGEDLLDGNGNLDAPLQHSERILDDQPVENFPHRLGDTFDLYDNGMSVRFKATKIVELDGRRITYGVPTTTR
jgi:hypothetical protein